eukprot:m.184198 g.184198  ORF g.184198 m.184198 type:complete len:579 (+) comp17484_c2_seq3:2991-4727(+)
MHDRVRLQVVQAGHGASAVDGQAQAGVPRHVVRCRRAQKLKQVPAAQLHHQADAGRRHADALDVDDVRVADGAEEGALAAEVEDGLAVHLRRDDDLDGDILLARRLAAQLAAVDPAKAAGAHERARAKRRLAVAELEAGERDHLAALVQLVHDGAERAGHGRLQVAAEQRRAHIHNCRVQASLAAGTAALLADGDRVERLVLVAVLVDEALPVVRVAPQRDIDRHGLDQAEDQPVAKDVDAVAGVDAVGAERQRDGHCRQIEGPEAGEEDDAWPALNAQGFGPGDRGEGQEHVAEGRQELDADQETDGPGHAVAVGPDVGAEGDALDHNDDAAPERAAEDGHADGVAAAAFLREKEADRVEGGVVEAVADAAEYGGEQAEVDGREALPDHGGDGQEEQREGKEALEVQVGRVDEQAGHVAAVPRLPPQLQLAQAHAHKLADLHAAEQQRQQAKAADRVKVGQPLAGAIAISAGVAHGDEKEKKDCSLLWVVVIVVVVWVVLVVVVLLVLLVMMLCLCYLPRLRVSISGLNSFWRRHCQLHQKNLEDTTQTSNLFRFQFLLCVHFTSHHFYMSSNLFLK